MPPRAAVDDDDDAPLARVTGPYPWEKPVIAKQVQEILDAVEVPAIHAETRASFHRAVYRQKYFPTEDVKGHIILTLRCILESEGNEDAIREPIIVSAVSTSIYNFADRGLALIEAFDRIPLTAILQTMRNLRIFGERSLSQYMAVSLRNKLYDIFEPAEAKPAKAAKVKSPPKAVNRIPSSKGRSCSACSCWSCDRRRPAISNSGDYVADSASNPWLRRKF
jgi:hypothetical protein